MTKGPKPRGDARRQRPGDPDGTLLDAFVEGQPGSLLTLLAPQHLVDANPAIRRRAVARLLGAAMDSPGRAAQAAQRALALATEQELPAARCGAVSLALAIVHRSGAREAYRRGNDQYELGLYDRSIAMYEEAIVADPGFGEAHFNRALCLYNLGAYRASAFAYEIAASLDRENPFIYNNLGDSLYRMQLFKEAAATYDKALALAPEYLKASYNRGLSLASLENYSAAIDDFSRVIGLKPDSGEAYHIRGLAYRFRGCGVEDQRRAISDFERALELNPSLSEARVHLAATKAALGEAEAGGAPAAFPPPHPQPRVDAGPAFISQLRRQSAAIDRLADELTDELAGVRRVRRVTGRSAEPPWKELMKAGDCESVAVLTMALSRVSPQLASAVAHQPIGVASEWLANLDPLGLLALVKSVHAEMSLGVAAGILERVEADRVIAGLDELAPRHHQDTTGPDGQVGRARQAVRMVEQLWPDGAEEHGLGRVWSSSFRLLAALSRAVPQAFARAANRYREAGDRDRSCCALEIACRLDPTDAALQAALGHAQLALGDRYGVGAVLERLGAKPGGQVAEWQLRASAHVADGDQRRARPALDLAEHYLETAGDTASNALAPLDIELAHLLEADEEYETALDRIERTIRRLGRSDDRVIEHARLAGLSGATESAAEDLRATAAAAAGDFRLAAEWLRALRHGGDVLRQQVHDSVVTLLAGLRARCASAPTPHALFVFASAAEAADQIEEARQAYEQLLGQLPEAGPIPRAQVAARYAALLRRIVAQREERLDSTPESLKDCKRLQELLDGSIDEPTFLEHASVGLDCARLNCLHVIAWVASWQAHEAAQAGKMTEAEELDAEVRQASQRFVDHARAIRLRAPDTSPDDLALGTYNLSLDAPLRSAVLLEESSQLAEEGIKRCSAADSSCLWSRDLLCAALVGLAEHDHTRLHELAPRIEAAVRAQRQDLSDPRPAVAAVVLARYHETLASAARTLAAFGQPLPDTDPAAESEACAARYLKAQLPTEAARQLLQAAGALVPTPAQGVRLPSPPAIAERDDRMASFLCRLDTVGTRWQRIEGALCRWQLALCAGDVAKAASRLAAAQRLFDEDQEASGATARASLIHAEVLQSRLAAGPLPRDSNAIEDAAEILSRTGHEWEAAALYLGLWGENPTVGAYLRRSRELAAFQALASGSLVAFRLAEYIEARLINEDAPDPVAALRGLFSRYLSLNENWLLALFPSLYYLDPRLGADDPSAEEGLRQRLTHQRPRVGEGTRAAPYRVASQLILGSEPFEKRFGLSAVSGGSPSEARRRFGTAAAPVPPITWQVQRKARVAQSIAQVVLEDFGRLAHHLARPPTEAGQWNANALAADIDPIYPCVDKLRGLGGGLSSVAELFDVIRERTDDRQEVAQLVRQLKEALLAVWRKWRIRCPRDEIHSAAEHELLRHVELEGRWNWQERDNVPDGFVLCGDPDRLREMVINLVSNAAESAMGAKAPRPTGHLVEITLSYTLPAAGPAAVGWVELLVRDRGDGPPDDKFLDHAYREGGVTSKPEGGGGKGLVSVRRDCELRGFGLGRLRSRSDGPPGSQTELWLPVVKG